MRKRQRNNALMHDAQVISQSSLLDTWSMNMVVGAYPLFGLQRKTGHTCATPGAEAGAGDVDLGRFLEGPAARAWASWGSM